MEKTISLAELEADPEAVAKDIRATRTIYWIRRPGKPTVRLRQLPDWYALIDAMIDPNWREDLEQSEREMRAGGGRDLEEVLAELGRARPVESKGRTATRRSASGRRASNRRRRTQSRGRSA